MIAAIRRWVLENFDDLLKLDLKIARILGAPAPHTLSSWAYKKSPFWRKIIDKIMWLVLNDADHCRKDYERVVNGFQDKTGESN